MSAPRPADEAGLPRQTPDRPTDSAPATAPVGGGPGTPRRVPSLRFLCDFRLPHALQNPLYRHSWWSQFVSLAGTWMQHVGPSLVVPSLTTSAIAIGAINVAAALPLLVFGFDLGELVPRLPWLAVTGNPYLFSGAANTLGQPLVLAASGALTALGSRALWQRGAWQAFVPPADTPGCAA